MKVTPYKKFGGHRAPPGPNDTKPLHGTFCEKMLSFSRFKSNFPQLANREHCFIMILYVCAQYIHACAQSLKAVCARTRAQLRGNTAPHPSTAFLVSQLSISFKFFLPKKKITRLKKLWKLWLHTPF